MDKILNKLLEEQKTTSDWYEKLEELYESMVSAQGRFPDLTPLILDYLEFPEENTTDLAPGDPNYFCRDYLVDIIYEYTQNNLTLEDAVSRLKKAKEVLRS